MDKNDDDRDTHYQFWAQTLLAEIKAAQEAGAPSEYIEKLIAQAAYDLVMTEQPEE